MRAWDVPLHQFTVVVNSTLVKTAQVLNHRKLSLDQFHTFFHLQGKQPFKAIRISDRTASKSQHRRW